MLRVTKLGGGASPIRLRLEGQIVNEWVAVLDEECARSLLEGERMVLDFSAVTFVDGRGVEMLKRIATERLQLENCSLFIEALLREGGLQG